MNTVYELSKLLQYSPKHLALFKSIKAEISPDCVGFHVLCPSWWTMRNEIFQSIFNNHSALLELWETILNDKPDSEARAWVNDIDSQMKMFDFYFEAFLLHNVLSHTDNLSKALQHTRLNTAEGQHLVRMTTATLSPLEQKKCTSYFGRKSSCKPMN